MAVRYSATSNRQSPMRLGVARVSVAITSSLLFILSLILTAYSAKNPWTANFGGRFSSIILSPFRGVSSGVSQGVGSIWSRYVALIDVHDENEKLLIQVRNLQAENSRLREMETENVRLRDLLKMSEELKLQGVAATVIGRDPSNWVNAITISAGRDRGIQTGMPVISGNGVVGKVVAVGASTARVLLISDHSSGADAIVQGSRARGVVEGQGKGLILDYIVLEEEVKVGESVITSGLDGVYPKGLLLGVVLEVSRVTGALFQSITIQPAVDLSRIEELFVVTSVTRVDELSTVKSPVIKTPSEKIVTTKVAAGAEKIEPKKTTQEQER